MMPPIKHSPAKSAFFSAVLHHQSEVEQAKLADRRVKAAATEVHRTRKAWLETIPDGAGLEVAHDVVWAHWWHDAPVRQWNCRTLHAQDGLAEMCEIARIVAQPITQTFMGSFVLTCSPGDTLGQMKARWEDAANAPEVVGAG